MLQTYIMMSRSLFQEHLSGVANFADIIKLVIKLIKQPLKTQR